MSSMKGKTSSNNSSGLAGRSFSEVCVGFDVLMDLGRPFMTDNTDIHFSGMQIDLSGRSLGEA